MGKTTEVVGFGVRPLADLSFNELMDQGVIDIAEIDDVVAVDQEELVGTPFVLFDWDIKESMSFGGEYAVCRVKTAEGTRVFADGGAGIVEALERYNRIRDDKDMADAPIYFHYGLRASTYMKEVDGKPTQATTYYFDNRRRP